MLSDNIGTKRKFEKFNERYKTFLSVFPLFSLYGSLYNSPMIYPSLLRLPSTIAIVLVGAVGWRNECPFNFRLKNQQKKKSHRSVFFIKNSDRDSGFYFSPLPVLSRPSQLLSPIKSPTTELIFIRGVITMAIDSDKG